MHSTLFSLFVVVLCMLSNVLATEPQNPCTKEDVFDNPNDPTHHTFLRCQLEPVQLECPDDSFFSPEKGGCVEKQIPLEHSTIEWEKLLKCPEDVDDQYLRNPYDCSRFYRCYKQETQQQQQQRLDMMHCETSMYFDETISACIPITTYHELKGDCHVEPLPKEIQDKERELREKEKLEREELEQLEELRKEQEILEREQREREHEERERVLQEREAKERAEIERLESERLELEQLEKKHQEKGRLELEEVKKLHQDIERLAKEKEESILKEQEREQKIREQLGKLQHEKEELEKKKKDLDDNEKQQEKKRVDDALKKFHDIFGHK